ncbi:hypothetical protein TUSST3_89690 [Streptomyces sp. TUS-ST3]|nr:hypothetical protein TUSST3_89690 [Streptomyces sp. TUS-ST3]
MGSTVSGDPSCSFSGALSVVDPDMPSPDWLVIVCCGAARTVGDEYVRAAPAMGVVLAAGGPQ